MSIYYDGHNRVRRVRSRSEHGLEPATHRAVPAASNLRCRASDTAEERVADFQVVVQIWFLATLEDYEVYNELHYTSCIHIAKYEPRIHIAKFILAA